MQDGTTDEVRLAPLSDTLFRAVLGRGHNNHNVNFKSAFLRFALHAAVVRCAAPKNTHAQHKTKPKVSAPVFKSRAGLTWPSLEKETREEESNQWTSEQQMI